MLLWHKDYFELKSLEKQQMHEGHSNLFFFSFWKQEITLPSERCLPVPGEKKYSSPWSQGPLLAFFLYISVTSPQLPLFVQSVGKAFRFCYLFGVHFLMRALPCPVTVKHIQSICVLFSLSICFMLIKFSGPAKNNKRVKVMFAFPP